MQGEAGATSLRAPRRAAASHPRAASPATPAAPDGGAAATRDALLALLAPPGAPPATLDAWLAAPVPPSPTLAATFQRVLEGVGPQGLASAMAAVGAAAAAAGTAAAAAGSSSPPTHALPPPARVVLAAVARIALAADPSAPAAPAGGDARRCGFTAMAGLDGAPGLRRAGLLATAEVALLAALRWGEGGE